jgi:heme o synthase
MLNASDEVLTHSPTPKVTGAWPVTLTVTQLFKLRVVVLLVFAAVAGAFLGAGGWPGTQALTVLLVTGALASAGSSAINQYIERDSDARMVRTACRPLACGAIVRPDWVPRVGAAMVFLPIISLVIYGLFAQRALSLSLTASYQFDPIALAAFLGLGAFVYVGIYTLWLKPRTPVNVVIGGLAGSCAVLSGGAAVGAWTDQGVLCLALLVFLWSPTHFWSLALACRDDYARAGVPMLPVVAAPRSAALLNLVHASASGLVGVALAFQPTLAWYYVVPVLGATLYWLAQACRVVIQPSVPTAWRLFYASNFYLGVVLLTVCIGTL